MSDDASTTELMYEHAATPRTIQHRKNAARNAKRKRKTDEERAQAERGQLEPAQLAVGMRLRRAQWAVTEAIQECVLSESYCEAERLALHTAGVALEIAIRLNMGELSGYALERLKDAKAKLDAIPAQTKGEASYPRIMALEELHRIMSGARKPTPRLVCSVVWFCADQFRRGATWIDKSKGPIQFSDEQLAAAQGVLDKWKRSKWIAINRLLAHWNLDVPPAPLDANEHPLAVIWRAHSRRKREK